MTDATFAFRFYDSNAVTIEAAGPWDGSAEQATHIIDWLLAHGTSSSFVAAGEWHHLRKFPEYDLDPGVEYTLGGPDPVPVKPDAPAFIVIPTLEGAHRADAGDFIIKGTRTPPEFYPCKPDVMATKYREAIRHLGLPETVGSIVRAEFELKLPVAGGTEVLVGRANVLLAKVRSQDGLELWVNVDNAADVYTTQAVEGAAFYKVLYGHPETADPAGDPAYAHETTASPTDA